MKLIPIADLHCDLLSYLANDERRTPFDLQVRCAIPQLRQGGVRVQGMAIFAETAPGSAAKGMAQADVFRQLLSQHQDVFTSWNGHSSPASSIAIAAAVENASAFWEEKEGLDEGWRRLDALRKKAGEILYLSLTWNTENRFGGGAFTACGLKEDGKRLVEGLAQRQIPLDLSHASDHLAHDVLEYADKKGVRLKVMASHSNMRSVVNHPRNLPDAIVKEIIARKGLLGLNFIRYLLGRESPEMFLKHVEHILNIGGGDAVCFGADFFYNGDVSAAHRKTDDELFYPFMGHSGAYPHVIELLGKCLGLDENALQRLCHGNFDKFFTRLAAGEG